MLALGYAGAGAVVQAIHKLGGFLAMSNLKEYTKNMLRSRLSMDIDRHDLFEGLVKKRKEWRMTFGRQ